MLPVINRDLENRVSVKNLQFKRRKFMDRSQFDTDVPVGQQLTEYSAVWLLEAWI